MRVRHSRRMNKRHVEAADNETRTTVRLFDPRRDHWGDHFHVDADQGLIIGITPVGRATVERLKMNSSTFGEAISLRFTDKPR